MRWKMDLSGYWSGELRLNPEIDVAAPAVITRGFYVPLPWNKQIENLRWPGPGTELSNVVERLANQNFRMVHRKFNEGIITYRRTVRIDPAAAPAGSRVFLVFEGSNYRTEVRVNGAPAGAHEGGHLRFEFDVTGLLVPGENTLEVTVDNNRRADAVPRDQFNWMDYGGIYRPVWLEWRPAVHLIGYAARPGRDDQGWFADVTAELSGPAIGPVVAHIESGGETAEGELRAQPSPPRFSARLRLRNPLVWEPGRGGMSSIRITYRPTAGPPDELEGAFGFRTIAAADRRLVVNGQPIRILGACLHEYHPSFGSTIPAWQTDYDLQLMKQVGLNAVRAAHYPHAQSFYDACDRAGMLVVAELPCWQFDQPQYGNPEVRGLATGMARDMVAQLGNHPSIFAWVIQNESAQLWEPAALEFFEAVHRAFKEADPERLTVSAGDPGPGHLDVTTEKDKPAPPSNRTDQFVDALGIHLYQGWYGGRGQDVGPILDRNHAERQSPLLLSTEMGVEGILGQRSLVMHPWSEDYQAELLCNHIRAILSRDFMAGFFIWLFVDYECSSISIRGINSKGLVDEFRRPKLAFNEVKHLLAEENRRGAESAKDAEKKGKKD